MRGRSVHEGGILTNGIGALMQAAPKGSFIPQPHENTVRIWPSINPEACFSRPQIYQYLDLELSTFRNYLIFATHKSIGSISPAPEGYITT